MKQYFINHKGEVIGTLTPVLAKIMGLFELVQASVGVENIKWAMGMLHDVITVIVVGSTGYVVAKFWKWAWPDKRKMG